MPRYRVTYEIESPRGISKPWPDGWRQIFGTESSPTIPPDAVVEEIVDRSGWYRRNDDESIIYWSEAEIKDFDGNEFFCDRVQYDVKPRET